MKHLEGSWFQYSWDLSKVTYTLPCSWVRFAVVQVSCGKAHSWQRGPNPLFYEDHPYIGYHHFSNFVHSPFPCPPQPPPPLLFLFSCFFGWMDNCVTFDALFYLVILWICKCWVLSFRPRWVFFAARHQVYWHLTYNVFFLLYSDLIHTYTNHTRTKTHSILRDEYTDTPI